jgi:hypothetical protein
LASNPNYPPSYAIEIYTDIGSICGVTRCTIAIPAAVTTPLVSFETSKRWSASLDLPPGTYGNPGGRRYAREWRERAFGKADD